MGISLISKPHFYCSWKMEDRILKKILWTGVFKTIEKSVRKIKKYVQLKLKLNKCLETNKQPYNIEEILVQGN